MRTIHLRTCTPVFIGTGETLEPSEYLIGGSRLYRLRIDALFGNILDRHPTAGDLFASWVDEMGARIAGERDSGKQSRLRDEFTLDNFVRTRLRDTELASQIRERIRQDASSRMYVIDIASLYGVRKRNMSVVTQRKRQIACAIKTASQEMYIPGSALKGMIRGAILSAFIRKLDASALTAVRTMLTQDLRAVRNPKREQARFAVSLERAAFVCGRQKPADDGHYDMFRFLHCGDSSSEKPDTIGLIAPLDLYLPNGDIQSQSPAVECIADGVKLTFRMSLDVDGLRNILRSANYTDWDGFDRRLLQVFGISIADLRTRPNDEIELRGIMYLLDALREYSASLLEWDKEWARNGKLSDALSLPVPAGANGALGHLGKGIGYHGLTVFLALRSHAGLKSLARDVLTTFESQSGKGSNSRTRSAREIDDSRYPVSRKLLSMPVTTGQRRQHVALPLGWVELSLSEHVRESDAGPAQTATNRDNSPAASVPKPQPEIKPLEAVRVGMRGIPAIVLRNGSKPLIVRLLVKGYETREIPCGGIGNLASVPPGTHVLVRVNEWDKKSAVVRSLTFEKNA